MRKWLAKLRKDERGLTLVELLAVVVILAIVAAIAFVMIGNVIENSKKDAHVANAQQLIASAKLYEASGEKIGADGVAPSDLESAGILGPLTSPWKEETYGTGAKVETKTDEGGKKVYKVTFNGEGCEITDRSEEELNNGGRDACN